MARDLAVLLDTIDVPQIDLVGYSMGAIVSLIFASTDERVRRLVIGGVGSGVIECGGVDRRAVPNDAIIEALSVEDPSQPRGARRPSPFASSRTRSAPTVRRSLAQASLGLPRRDRAGATSRRRRCCWRGTPIRSRSARRSWPMRFPSATLEMLSRESHRSPGRPALQTVHRRLPRLTAAHELRRDRRDRLRRARGGHDQHGRRQRDADHLSGAAGLRLRAGDGERVEHDRPGPGLDLGRDRLPPRARRPARAARSGWGRCRCWAASPARCCCWCCRRRRSRRSCRSSSRSRWSWSCCSRA